MRVVSGRCGHPGAHRPDPAATDDLSDRTLTNTALSFLLEIIDLLVQVLEHAGVPDNDRVYVLKRSWLPQRIPEAGGTGNTVPAPVHPDESPQ